MNIKFTLVLYWVNGCNWQCFHALLFIKSINDDVILKPYMAIDMGNCQKEISFKN